MNGVQISESGLVAALHLIGIGDLIKAFEANDLASVEDGNKITPKEYMELFEGYDLSAIK